MGQFTIVVHGTGAHHNEQNPGDADRLTDEFVSKLRDAGHSIEAATFTAGSRQHARPIPAVEKANPESDAT